MVQARRPHHHPIPPPIAHHPAYVFARHAGHRRAVALADMLADLEDRTRQACLYRQKAGGGHCLVGLSQARGHHVDEVLVNFRMPYGPFFEFRAADEPQLAISDREHRRRPRLSVEDGKLADDCAGAEHGQDTLFAPRRGYNDLEQALLEAITTITWCS